METTSQSRKDELCTPVKVLALSKYKQKSNQINNKICVNENNDRESRKTERALHSFNSDKIRKNGVNKIFHEESDAQCEYTYQFHRLNEQQKVTLKSHKKTFCDNQHHMNVKLKSENDKCNKNSLCLDTVTSSVHMVDCDSIFVNKILPLNSKDEKNSSPAIALNLPNEVNKDCSKIEHDMKSEGSEKSNATSFEVIACNEKNTTKFKFSDNNFVDFLEKGFHSIKKNMLHDVDRNLATSELNKNFSYCANIQGNLNAENVVCADLNSKIGKRDSHDKIIEEIECLVENNLEKKCKNMESLVEKPVNKNFNKELNLNIRRDEGYYCGEKYINLILNRQCSYFSSNSLESTHQCRKEENKNHNKNVENISNFSPETSDYINKSVLIPGQIKKINKHKILWLKDGLFKINSGNQPDMKEWSRPSYIDFIEKSLVVMPGICSKCHKFYEDLISHVSEAHIYLSYIPVYLTSAFKHHMIERFGNVDSMYADVLYENPLHVCKSCGFILKTMNEVRLHLNIHENIYTVKNSSKRLCKCSNKYFLYHAHKLKSLLLSSNAKCSFCNYYFCCEDSLQVHLQIIHFKNQICSMCSNEKENSNSNFIFLHNKLHSTNDFSYFDTFKTFLTYCYYYSWNSLENSLNYLDGKAFQINYFKKLQYLNYWERSYLQYPINVVPEIATVDFNLALSPSKHIVKYLRTKTDLKILNFEAYDFIYKQCDLNIQLLFQNYLQRKRKPKSDSKRRKLGLLDYNLSLSFNGRKSSLNNKQLTVKIRDLKYDIKISESSKPCTRTSLFESRTRYGMKPKNENSQNFKNPNVKAAIISGEWILCHTFVCCSCGLVFPDLAEIMDHKWLIHPNVWCAHTMIRGRVIVPKIFQQQYISSSLSQVKKLKIKSNKEKLICSHCKEIFENYEKLHDHMIEISGISEIMNKKKIKKGQRFNSKKGQGVPNRRYSLSNSIIRTPNKDQFENRDSINVSLNKFVSQGCADFKEKAYVSRQLNFSSKQSRNLKKSSIESKRAQHFKIKNQIRFLRLKRRECLRGDAILSRSLSTNLKNIENCNKKLNSINSSVSLNVKSKKCHTKAKVTKPFESTFLERNKVLGKFMRKKCVKTEGKVDKKVINFELTHSNMKPVVKLHKLSTTDQMVGNELISKTKSRRGKKYDEPKQKKPVVKSKIKKAVEKFDKPIRKSTVIEENYENFDASLIKRKGKIFNKPFIKRKKGKIKEAEEKFYRTNMKSKISKIGKIKDAEKKIYITDMKNKRSEFDKPEMKRRGKREADEKSDKPSMKSKIKRQLRSNLKLRNSKYRTCKSKNTVNDLSPESFLKNTSDKKIKSKAVTFSNTNLKPKSVFSVLDDSRTSNIEKRSILNSNQIITMPLARPISFATNKISNSKTCRRHSTENEATRNSSIKRKSVTRRHSVDVFDNACFNSISLFEQNFSTSAFVTDIEKRVEVKSVSDTEISKMASKKMKHLIVLPKKRRKGSNAKEKTCITKSLKSNAKKKSRKMENAAIENPLNSVSQLNLNESFSGKQSNDNEAILKAKDVDALKDSCDEGYGFEDKSKVIDDKKLMPMSTVKEFNLKQKIERKSYMLQRLFSAVNYGKGNSEERPLVPAETSELSESRERSFSFENGDNELTITTYTVLKSNSANDSLNISPKKTLATPDISIITTKCINQINSSESNVFNYESIHPSMNKVISPQNHRVNEIKLNDKKAKPKPLSESLTIDSSLPDDKTQLEYHKEADLYQETINKVIEKYCSKNDEKNTKSKEISLLPKTLKSKLKRANKKVNKVKRKIKTQPLSKLVTISKNKRLCNLRLKAYTRKLSKTLKESTLTQELRGSSILNQQKPENIALDTKVNETLKAANFPATDNLKAKNVDKKRFLSRMCDFKPEIIKNYKQNRIIGREGLRNISLKSKRYSLRFCNNLLEESYAIENKLKNGVENLLKSDNDAENLKQSVNNSEDLDNGSKNLDLENESTELKNSDKYSQNLDRSEKNLEKLKNSSKSLQKLETDFKNLESSEKESKSVKKLKNTSKKFEKPENDFNCLLKTENDFMNLNKSENESKNLENSKNSLKNLKKSKKDSESLEKSENDFSNLEKSEKRSKSLEKSENDFKNLKKTKKKSKILKKSNYKCLKKYKSASGNREKYEILENRPEKKDNEVNSKDGNASNFSYTNDITDRADSPKEVKKLETKKLLEDGCDNNATMSQRVELFPNSFNAEPNKISNVDLNFSVDESNISQLSSTDESTEIDKFDLLLQTPNPILDVNDWQAKLVGDVSKRTPIPVGDLKNHIFHKSPKDSEVSSKKVKKLQNEEHCLKKLAIPNCSNAECFEKTLPNYESTKNILNAPVIKEASSNNYTVTGNDNLVKDTISDEVPIKENKKCVLNRLFRKRKLATKAALKSYETDKSSDIKICSKETKVIRKDNRRYSLRPNVNPSTIDYATSDEETNEINSAAQMEAILLQRTKEDSLKEAVEIAKPETEIGVQNVSTHDLNTINDCDSPIIETCKHNSDQDSNQHSACTYIDYIPKELPRSNKRFKSENNSSRNKISDIFKLTEKDTQQKTIRTKVLNKRTPKSSKRRKRKRISRNLKSNNESSEEESLSCDSAMKIHNKFRLYNNLNSRKRLKSVNDDAPILNSNEASNTINISETNRKLTNSMNTKVLPSQKCNVKEDESVKVLSFKSLNENTGATKSSLLSIESGKIFDRMYKNARVSVIDENNPDKMCRREKISELNSIVSMKRNELFCGDCGLSFDSVMSREDHQQDCRNIALEMTLMAEDNLYDCPHCHLSFALKGTQRKHIASRHMKRMKKPTRRTKIVPDITSEKDTLQASQISSCEGDEIKMLSPVPERNYLKSSLRKAESNVESTIAELQALIDKDNLLKDICLILLRNSLNTNDIRLILSNSLSSEAPTVLEIPKHVKSQISHDKTSNLRYLKRISLISQNINHSKKHGTEKNLLDKGNTSKKIHLNASTTEIFDSLRSLEKILLDIESSESVLQKERMIVTMRQHFHAATNS